MSAERVLSVGGWVTDTSYIIYFSIFFFFQLNLGYPVHHAHTEPSVAILRTLDENVSVERCIFHIFSVDMSKSEIYFLH